jgi:hypothetical protein
MVVPPLPAGKVAATAERARRHAADAVDFLRSGWFLPTLAHAARLHPRASTTGLPAPLDLRASLGSFGRRAQIAWYLTAARRALLAGLLVGLIFAAIAAWLNWPAAIGADATLAIVLALLVNARRGAPNLMTTARFLDRALHLKEQLATALELESLPASTSSSLGKRARLAAVDAGQDAATHWQIRPVRAGREWASLAALLVAFAIIVMHRPGQSAPAALVASGIPSSNLSPSVSPPRNGASSAQSIAIHVAVVSTQDGAAAPLKSASVPGSRPSSSAVHGLANRPAARGAATATASSSSSKVTGGKTSVTTSGHGVPLKFNQSFMATSPSSKAQKGGQIAGNLGHASTKGANGGKSAGNPSSRGSQASSNSAKSGSGSAAANGGAQPAGKAASAGAKTPGKCLHTCNQFDKSQIAKPGLIVGKGQFSGTSAPGGKTAGHAAGSAPKLGSAKAAPPAAGRQLSITSGYGPTHQVPLPSTQAQGHDGPGSSGQSAVSSGAQTIQALDYVPPDANLTNPGDAGIVMRYFTPSPAS